MDWLKRLIGDQEPGVPVGELLEALGRREPSDADARDEWLAEALVDGGYRWLAAQREYIARIQGHALRVGSFVVAVVAIAASRIAEKGSDALTWELYLALGTTAVFVGLLGSIHFMSSTGDRHRFAQPGIDPINFLHDVNDETDSDPARLLAVKLGLAARDNDEKLKKYTRLWNFALFFGLLTATGWTFASFRILG